MTPCGPWLTFLAGLGAGLSIGLVAFGAILAGLIWYSARLQRRERANQGRTHA